MSVKTYDPNRVIIVLADQHISGFAEDSMVEVTFDEQTFTKKVGVDGEVTRTRSRNECATAKLKLIQTSFSNNVSRRSRSSTRTPATESRRSQSKT